MGRSTIMQFALLLLTVSFVPARSKTFVKRGDGCGLQDVVNCLTKYAEFFKEEEATDRTNDELVTQVHCKADQVDMYM